MKKSILGALVVLMFVAVGIASAPPLTFTFSDVHANKTAMETDTFAVNNAGAIAGDYVDAKNVQHAMILAGKKLTTVDHKNCVTSGGFSSGAIAFYGINAAGAAAGWCTSTKTSLYQGFVYAAGKFTAINFPKSNGTQAIGINDKGDVVGLYLDSGSVQHGFVKKGSKYTSIDVAGDTTTEAWGINNAGQITVFALNSVGTYESFLYNGKTFKKIIDPNAGATGTIARIVNNKGDVAGAYFNSSGSEIGFLRHGGKYYDVKDPNATSTRPDGLNDTLEIVGRYISTTGATVGFKATTK
ncbi:MAG TPA: hypothetical protein VNZ03_36985 [Terriglobales bacterium]|nr:hypothetical protein [Terriglobales bacterium]